MNWQPIETAPRDGTRVDLWCVNPEGRTARRCGCRWAEQIDSWSQVEFYGWTGLGWNYRNYTPTHWLLIQPPA